MIYLLMAYLVIWALTFGYILFLGARAKKLEREVWLLQQSSVEGADTDR